MIPEKVKTQLDRHGLVAMEFEAGSTPTSEMAANKIGVAVGQIAKSILFKKKDGTYFLIVCPGDSRISNKKLKNLLGGKARMATASETESVTGFLPGGVCPFGVDDIAIYVDKGLSRFETVYPAAGTDGSGVAVSFDSLCAITGGVAEDFCE